MSSLAWRPDRRSVAAPSKRLIPVRLIEIVRRNTETTPERFRAGRGCRRSRSDDPTTTSECADRARVTSRRCRRIGPAVPLRRVRLASQAPRRFAPDDVVMQMGDGDPRAVRQQPRRRTPPFILELFGVPSTNRCPLTPAVTRSLGSVRARARSPATACDTSRSSDVLPPAGARASLRVGSEAVR
jgi:hypothetical protein